MAPSSGGTLTSGSQQHVLPVEKKSTSGHDEDEEVDIEGEVDDNNRDSVATAAETTHGNNTATTTAEKDADSNTMVVEDGTEEGGDKSDTLQKDGNEARKDASHPTAATDAQKTGDAAASQKKDGESAAEGDAEGKDGKAKAPGDSGDGDDDGGSAEKIQDGDASGSMSGTKRLVYTFTARSKYTTTTTTTTITAVNTVQTLLLPPSPWKQVGYYHPAGRPPPGRPLARSVGVY